jgi:hypothetical protein
LAATVGAVTQLPSIDKAGAGAIGSLVPEQSEALRAERLSKTLFAFPLLSRNVVVVSAGERLPRETLQRLALSAERATGGRLDLPGLVAAAPVPGQLLTSQGEATTALTYLFFRPTSDRDRQPAAARAYADRLERELGGTVDVAVTGAVPAALARSDVVLEHLPLVELAINVAYVPPAAGAVSIGFAIPAPLAVQVVEELLADGHVDYPYLGLALAPLVPDAGLAVDQGVLIGTVEEGGPADEAGLEGGDVIVRAGDREVRRIEDVYAALRERAPGDELEIQVVQPGAGAASSRARPAR